MATLLYVTAATCRSAFVGQPYAQQVLRHRDVRGLYGLHRDTALAASPKDGTSSKKPNRFKKGFQKREVPVDEKSPYLTKLTRKNWQILVKKYEFLKAKLEAQTRSGQIAELRSKVADLQAKLNERTEGMGLVIDRVSARCDWLSKNMFVDKEPISASAVLRLCRLDSVSKAMEILATLEAQHDKIDYPSRWLVAAVSKVETARKEREIAAAAADQDAQKMLREEQIRRVVMTSEFQAEVIEIHKDGVWVSIGNEGYKNWRAKLMVPSQYMDKVRMGSRFNGLKAEKVEPASRTVSLVADDWEGRLSNAIDRVEWTDLEEGDTVKGYVVGRTISEKSGPLVEVDVGADHVAHMYASSLDAKRKVVGDLPQPMDLVVQAVDVDGMKIRVDFVDAEN